MGLSGHRRFRRQLLGALVGVGAMMLSLTVIGASSATSTPKAAASGTISFAELPGSGPNYIFPFAGLSVLQRLQHPVLPVPHVPTALLVRHESLLTTRSIRPTRSRRNRSIATGTRS